MTQPTQKKYLEDVAILRILLIFFLIWNHAFAPFTGAWEKIDGIAPNDTYYWFGKALYHMRIQALIFISGYLLGYTALRKPQALKFNQCILKKVHRLLLPSIIFSSLYYYLFYDHSASIPTIVYRIVNGCGHMWFLPMLFWCFVAVWGISHFKIRSTLVLWLTAILSIIPFPEIPMRLNLVAHYFIYFYLGFGIRRGYFKFFMPNVSLKPITACIAIYITVFTVKECFLTQFTLNSTEILAEGGGNALILKGLHLSTNNLCALIMSISGLFAAYWSTHYFFIGKRKLPTWVINLSFYCYGVYICQQFILKWMYYHTQLPNICGAIALPWISLLITLITSLTITHLLLRTKIGRFLIG